MATIAMPFRALQLVIDSLLRHAPHKARTEREREQADEVYKPNLSIRVGLTRCLELDVDCKFLSHLCRFLLQEKHHHPLT